MKKLILVVLLFVQFAYSTTVVVDFPPFTENDINTTVTPNISQGIVTAFDAFNSIATINYTVYGSGKFIDGVNGVIANWSIGQEWWTFYVNGAPSLWAGVSDHTISNNDTIGLEYQFLYTDVASLAARWLLDNPDASGQFGVNYVQGNAFSLMALSLVKTLNLVNSAIADPAIQSGVNYTKQFKLLNAGLNYGTTNSSHPNYTADVLHTSVATMAFIAVDSIKDLFTTKNTSIDFIMSKQNLDGGFGFYSNTSDVDTTSWATLAILASGNSLPEKNNNTPSGYLLSMQNSTGCGGFRFNSSEPNSVMWTAEALIALKAAGESTNTTEAIIYLKGNQSGDGCFSDAYLTALSSIALRAYGENESADNASRCLETLAMADGGFSRYMTTSNAVDTAFAVFALMNKSLPLFKLTDSQGPNVSVTFSKPAWNNVLLQANTSEPAICKYSVNSAEVYDSMHFFSSTGAKTHLTQVTLGEGGPYTLFVYCKDISGNTNTNAAYTGAFNINVPPSPPSSGGGGGGGGGSWSGTAGHGESHLISRIVANEPRTITINTENYSVYELEITPLNDLRNVRLTVELLKEKPSSLVLDPDGVVYKYLEISWTGLSDEHIADAKIRFKLSKDWLAANNYEDKHAVLWRGADNTWVRLPTYEIDEEDYWYKYYEAKTLWFSPFVVTLTDIEYTEPEEETAAEEESEVVEEAPETQETAPSTGITGLVAGEGGFNIDPVLVLLLFALIGAVLIYFNVIVKIRESKDLT